MTIRRCLHPCSRTYKYVKMKMYVCMYFDPDPGSVSGSGDIAYRLRWLPKRNSNFRIQAKTYVCMNVCLNYLFSCSSKTDVHFVIRTFLLSTSCLISPFCNQIKKLKHRLHKRKIVSQKLFIKYGLN